MKSSVSEPGLRMQLDKLLSVLQPSVSRTVIELVHYHHNLPVGKNRLLTILVNTSIAAIRTNLGS